MFWLIGFVKHHPDRSTFSLPQPKNIVLPLTLFDNIHVFKLVPIKRIQLKNIADKFKVPVTPLKSKVCKPSPVKLVQLLNIRDIFKFTVVVGKVNCKVSPVKLVQFSNIWAKFKSPLTPLKSKVCKPSPVKLVQFSNIRDISKLSKVVGKVNCKFSPVKDTLLQPKNIPAKFKIPLTPLKSKVCKPSPIKLVQLLNIPDISKLPKVVGKVNCKFSPVNNSLLQLKNIPDKSKFPLTPLKFKVCKPSPVKLVQFKNI